MLLRRIARPMLASWFVTEGIDAARAPGSHVDLVRPTVDAVLGRVTSVPRPTDGQLRTIVQVHGVLTALAGMALAVGRAPRTAALVLAGLTVPLAVANLPLGHPTPEQKKARKERFVRALAFTGAAVIAGVDLEGRPGLSWRVAKARERVATRSGAALTGAAGHAKGAAAHAKGVVTHR
ncbi:DoxX family membrane protein [Cellulomonas fimi]|uniref:DoxX family membrane protein n=1 Tax=Cellulomonas fimi TaxID=1708 RepID=A0A7Y0LZ76_CELFI|nr:DoxX family membrane protein [Cellulomonas fimi]NMR20815.1 DoxX family membrane protein [Cellulomonas fimi]